jgi:beta-galactosidase
MDSGGNICRNRIAFRVALGLLVFLVLPVSLGAQPATSLAGFWLFELDPADAGVREQWFARGLRNRIQLPGILQAQKFGNQITTGTPWMMTLFDRYWYLRDDYKEYVMPGKVKVPFLSQPPLHYLGPAWYQREILIPRSVGRRTALMLERPHWVTSVWIDERLLGSSTSLVAPHFYDLGTISPGRHRLTIRVDNRLLLPYRPDAHSLSDSAGGSGNGIVGRIELTETGRVWIDDAQVFPNLKQRTMLIKVRVGNSTGRSGQGTLTAIWPDIGVVPVYWDEEGGTAEVEVPLRHDMETWDEFQPKLHQLRLWLQAPGTDEYKDLAIGLRDFHTEGNQFVMNGRPIIFRGTTNGGDFPLTGYPPTDIKSWVTLFETCKRWGLNHMRFHSWCPPEAAFAAADQVGFYLQVEPGMWNEINPGSPMERVLYEETDRIIKAYGNHPSFMLLSASHEPAGDWRVSLPRWVSNYHNKDPRRLYTSGTGHTEREIPNFGADYLALHRIGPLMLRREAAWFGGDFRQALIENEIQIPVISHEIGQWAAYPDYEVIKKFRGHLRPANYEIFRDSMEAHGLLDKNKSFAQASGRFQFECYKEEIEANLRTPGLSGFQLFALHDYPGQGTSLVGLLDAFWEPKSYARADEFREFCNATVPLARMSKRVFTTNDSLNVDVEVAHFGPEPIENAKAVWRIGEDPPIAEGSWDIPNIPIGKNIPLGRISMNLAKLSAPSQYRLSVTVGPASLFDATTLKIIPSPNAVRGSTYFENSWTFWVYPPTLPDEFRGTDKCPVTRPPEFLITRSWDEAEKKLAAGGKVLLVPQPSDLDWSSPPLDTVPIFGNRLLRPAWGRMLGFLIDLDPSKSKSYALGNFMTSSSFDWQWAQLLYNVRAINLDRLPPELEPTVWAIDDWNRNYKLGVIFEGAVGEGRLLVSAIDVTKTLDRNPVARQLRYSLLNYMASDCFHPQIPIPPAQLQSLFFDTRIMKKLGATAQVNGEPASTVIDGDPNTFILAGDPNAQLREPPDIVISFPAPVAMSGLIVMPRQNHREHEGEIREYAVQISDDGQVWRPLTQGAFVSSFAPQQVQFGKPITTRYLKLVSLSGFGPDKMTSLAELAVIYAGPKLN